jgi:uncharacterized membrane protein
MRPTKYLAILLAAVGALMLIYAIFTPNEGSGMGSGNVSYSDSNMILGVAGAFMVAIGASYFFLKEEYVPYAPPALAPSEPKVEKEAPVEKPQEVKCDAPESEEKMNEIALRLLGGDERILYKAIVDAGGTALQKDLIVSTKMSDAKVSRTIDRLVEKGMVTKERYGVTNRIRTTTGE